MKKQFSSKYPLIHQIVLSDDSLLYKPNENSLKVKSQFGADNYVLWNLTSTRDFISDNYPPHVTAAFDSLLPYAYKCDLARFCILNHFGGIYADVSVGKIRPINVGEKEMVIFRDLNSDRTSWKVATSFFYSVPKNPILLDAIEQIVANVNNNYYGYDPHFPTGPSVFGLAVAKFGLQVDLLIGQYWWFKNRRNKFVLSNNIVIARHKRGGSRMGGNSGILGGNNYNELWANRRVYGKGQSA